MEPENKTKIKKKIFYKSQKNALTTPLSGFIITCDNHKEKNAINDAYNILNEVFHYHYHIYNIYTNLTK